MKLKLAICQFDIKEGAAKANLEKAEKLIKAAAAEGADIILIPEMWPCGFDFDRMGELSQELSGNTVGNLRSWAKELGVFLIGGSFPESRKGGVYNTCPVINVKGELVNKYRKIHLFSHYMNEHLYLKPGEEWAHTEYKKAGESIILGHMICYDLRFPELARNLALRGARLFTVPAGWPQARISEFETLCRARAIENRSFLMCANYSDTINGEYCGNSMIIDPSGEVLCKMENEEGFRVAEIDTDILKEERTFNSIADRRNFLDEIDNNLL